MVNPYIVGKNVYLRHPIEDDVYGGWYEWFSDEEITKYLTERHWPNSQDTQLDFYKSLKDNKEKLVLSIIDKGNDKHIGIISLSGINWVHRYAEISVVIGDKDYNHGTVLTESFALMLKIAFTKLNLLNLMSAYAESNEKSKVLHRLFKFKQGGCLKNFLFINEKYEDLIIEFIDQESWIERNHK
ncbi:MAG: hypothetical protein CMG74_04340 [Candidatus Marinimicrobia bacterium]|nr:hypothetical protein [Candidatus Neomarinimicrobiota bacterium]|tara:strand:- start:20498 stop:21052 length:555 start_codon:yes stop_codon:yes gene_type:complete